MVKRKGARNLKSEFKDYAALASNDIELIEIDRTRQMSLGNLKNQLSDEINNNEKHFAEMKKKRSEINQIASDNNSAPIVKAENTATKAKAYDLAQENEKLRKELENVKKELKNRHVFGRIANMKQAKVSFTMSLPKVFNTLLEKEAKKSGMSKTHLSRLAIVNLLISKGHDIVFESEI